MNKYIVYIEEQKLVNWRDGGKASKGEYSLNKLRYVKVSNTGIELDRFYFKLKAEKQIGRLVRLTRLAPLMKITAHA